MDSHGQVKHLEAVEEHIRDIKDCIMGRETGKVYEDLKINLANLQGERRMLIWTMNRDELRDKVRVSLDGTHVLDYQGAIPDL